MDENRDGFPEEAQDRQDHRAEAPLPDIEPPELFRQENAPEETGQPVREPGQRSEERR